MKRIKHLKAFVLQAGIILNTAGLAMLAGAAENQFNVPQQSMESALKAFAEQANIQLLFSSDTVSGLNSSGISGPMETEPALKKLLGDSGLYYEFTAENSVVVKVATEKKAIAAAKEEGAATDRKVINEIVVTATKRETSLQDTAMSITALGDEEIARRGLVSMGDYLNSVPGVNFLDQTAIAKSIVIRGVSATPQADGVFGSLVGVYLGEAPIAGLVGYSADPDIKMIDIERVEVLRGPQGTLYGSSNLGGTVRNIPVQPKLEEFEGQVKAGYSNTGKRGGGNSEIRGIINIPLIEDELAIRAVAYHFENSGYYKNIGANDPDIGAAIETYGAVAVEKSDIGTDTYIGGRISALWRPNEKLSVELMYLQQEVEQDGWPSADLSLGRGEFLQRRMQIRRADSPPDFGEPLFGEKFATNVEIANATVEYDFGWGSILSSTSWVDDESIRHRELGPIYFGFLPWSQPASQSSGAFVEELRLSSQFDGPFQFVAGLYYEDVEQGFRDWGIFGGDPENNPFGDRIIFFDNDAKLTTEQKAIFGEISYEITEQVKLTAGMRAFTYDKEDKKVFRDAVFSPGGSVDISKADQHGESYKLGLDYTPNENTLFYALWSEGFRLGRPLQPSIAALCDADDDGFVDGSNGITVGSRSLDSDYLDSYELGGKFTLLDDRLQLRTSVYQLNWDKVPVTQRFRDACFVSVNAGEARVRGAELESTYYITAGIVVNFGASYNKAELIEDVPSVGIAGDRLPGSPEYNFSLGLQYELFIAGHEAYIRSDYYYVGGFYNDLQQTSIEAGDYGKWNARAGLQFNQISAELFIDNITNEDALTLVDYEPGPMGYHLRPRTIGLNIGYKF